MKDGKPRYEKRGNFEGIEAKVGSEQFNKMLQVNGQMCIDMIADLVRHDAIRDEILNEVPVDVMFDIAESVHERSENVLEQIGAYCALITNLMMTVIACVEHVNFQAEIMDMEKEINGEHGEHGDNA